VRDKTTYINVAFYLVRLVKRSNNGCPLYKLELIVCVSKQTKENKMTGLTALKLTAIKKPTQIPQVLQRRLKLSKRLWEQIELAKAEQGGTTFSVQKFRSYTDKESGLRKQIETNKRLKSWWFVGDNGKLAIAVRYGARVLELAKGKYAVEISTANDLVSTLQIIKSAVEAGELDEAIDVAANKLRSGFTK